MIEETREEYLTILNGADPLDKLNEIAATINEHYFDVGCILYHLKESDTYKQIDGEKYKSEKHSKWKQFCEDKLSISYRTAQYWVNLYRYFSEMGISRDKIQSLGWSKAKELIDSTDDPEVLDRFIQAAEEMTINELQAFIESYTENGEPGEVTKFKRFNFNLPEAMSEHAEEILKLAAKSCDGNQNEAFFKILIEWSQVYHPLPDNAENTYLVEADENGQALPDNILKLFA